MPAMHYVITASVSATPKPASVNVVFDNVSTFAAAFRQILYGWSLGGGGGWTWMGLAGQGTTELVALTGPGVTAKVGIGGAGMNVPVTFTLLGRNGPMATHTTPANVTSDSFTFDVAGAGWTDIEVAVLLQQFAQQS